MAGPFLNRAAGWRCVEEAAMASGGVVVNAALSR
jgi:hypothetical protein